MKIFATYNIKGGVGKTTAAVNLAYLSAADGYRTLLWDLDPQGAASFLFRIKPRVKGGGKALIRGTRALDDAIKGTDFDHLDLIPADFTYRNMDLLLGGANGKPTRKLAQLLRPLAAEYDHVFLDCPPSISLVSENVMHAADVLLVPLIPTTCRCARWTSSPSSWPTSPAAAPRFARSSPWWTGARSCTRRQSKTLRPNDPGWPPPPSPRSP